MIQIKLKDDGTYELKMDSETIEEFIEKHISHKKKLEMCYNEFGHKPKAFMEFAKHCLKESKNNSKFFSEIANEKTILAEIAGESYKKVSDDYDNSRRFWQEVIELIKKYEG